MYKRVATEERGVDWHSENSLPDETHAIHGGSLPLTTSEGFKGIFIPTELQQMDHHLFTVEVLTEFLTPKGEKI